MAKPIQGTKQNDPVAVLTGTNGNDKLKGKDGNDTLKGGLGNDDIDGGGGIDTALYTGSINDYVISFKGTGNNKITVSGGTDGADSLKNVEFLQFDDGAVNVTNGAQWQYFVNAEVDESGQKPATEDVINGSGIPATGYNLAVNQTAGVELGMQVHYRQGPTVLASDVNGYADGVLHFQVNDGPQSTANGSQSNVANRAAWSFDYSIITGLNAATTDLDDFVFQFLVDVDPTAATDYQVFTMEPGGAGSAGVHWANQYGDVVGDDQGIAGQIAQNSRNLAFYDVDHVTPLTQPYDILFGPGQFDVVLQAFDLSNNLIAQNHIVVDVV
jgi:hypothetical protein